MSHRLRRVHACLVLAVASLSTHVAHAQPATMPAASQPATLRLPNMPLHDPFILAHAPSKTYYLYTSNVPRLTGVKAAGYHVDQAVGNADVHLNLRVALHEDRHDRFQQERHRISKNIDPHTSGGRIAEPVEVVCSLAHRLQRAFYRRSKFFPGRREGHAARGPVKEPG